MILLHVLAFLAFQFCYIAAWLPLAALGHPIAAILIYLGLKRQKSVGGWPWMHFSKAYKQRYKGFPHWAYVWSNEGDSVLGSDDYILQGLKSGKGRLKIGYTWSAVRNPVNNLRFIPPFNLKIVPQNVRWVGTLGNYKEPVADGLMTDPADYKNREMGLEYDKKQPFLLFCWCKGAPLKANLLWQYESPINGRMVKLQTGFKIYPKDLQGFTTPYRASGAGNALISWKYI